MIAEERMVMKWPEDEQPRTGSSGRSGWDWIAREHELSLLLNGQPLAVLACSPDSERELVVGFLKTEGIIDSLFDIECILCDSAPSRIDVRITNAAEHVHGNFDTAAWTRGQMRTSGCGRGWSTRQAYRANTLRPLDLPATVTPDFIIALQRLTTPRTEWHRNTGCLHHAVLAFPDGRGITKEDIGRHNAVDKVIGAAMLGALSLPTAVLSSSGRLSSEIVVKAASAGIPVVVSRSAPTTAAIDAAERYGVTLVGFARARRFNVYTHAERIDWPVTASRERHVISSSPRQGTDADPLRTSLSSETKLIISEVS